MRDLNRQYRSFAEFEREELFEGESFFDSLNDFTDESSPLDFDEDAASPRRSRRRYKN